MAEIDWDAELDRIFNEPPDPRLLALAGKAVEAQRKYKEWFAQLAPAEQEEAKAAEIQRGVDFIMNGPDGIGDPDDTAAEILEWMIPEDPSD